MLEIFENLICLQEQNLKKDNENVTFSSLSVLTNIFTQNQNFKN